MENSTTSPSSSSSSMLLQHQYYLDLIPTCSPLDYALMPGDYQDAGANASANLSGGFLAADGAWTPGAGCGPGAQGEAEEYVNPLDNPLTKGIFILLYALVFLLAFVGELSFCNKH